MLDQRVLFILLFFWHVCQFAFLNLMLFFLSVSLPFLITLMLFEFERKNRSGFIKMKALYSYALVARMQKLSKKAKNARQLNVYAMNQPTKRPPDW